VTVDVQAPEGTREPQNETNPFEFEALPEREYEPYEELNEDDLNVLVDILLELQANGRPTTGG
jgi:hypothetical protein